MTSKIEWTEETWNPIVGCSVVSPGCTNCYAMRRVAPRLAGNPATPHYAGTVQPSKGGYVWTGKIGIAGDSAFLKPLRTKKPTMFFVNSMSDLFHENVPDEVIDRIFAIMAMCPQHTFQLLTKRSARMREYMNGHQSNIPYLGRMPLERIHLEAAGHMEGDGGLMDELKKHGNIYSLYLSAPWPLRNVWLGVSAEDQPRADLRIPDLLATPATVRFVSAEPLLGPIDFCKTGLSMPMENHPWRNGPMLQGIHWIIVGGETGKGSNPMHPYWARLIRDQVHDVRVIWERSAPTLMKNAPKFFFKQWGDWAHMPERAHFKDEYREPWQRVASSVDGVRPALMFRIGKKAAGRLLDGVDHNAMPQVKP